MAMLQPTARERLAGGRPRLAAVPQAQVLAEVHAEHEPEEQPDDRHDEEPDDPEYRAQRQRAPRDPASFSRLPGSRYLTTVPTTTIASGDAEHGPRRARRRGARPTRRCRPRRAPGPGSTGTTTPTSPTTTSTAATTIETLTRASCPAPTTIAGHGTPAPAAGDAARPGRSDHARAARRCPRRGGRRVSAARPGARPRRRTGRPPPAVNGWVSSSPANAATSVGGDGGDPVEALGDRALVAVVELGAPDPVHPRRRVLQPEHQPAAQVALRADDLGGRQPVRRDLGEHVADDRDDLLQPLRRAPRVHAEARRRRRSDTDDEYTEYASPRCSRTCWNSRELGPPPSAVLSTEQRRAPRVVPRQPGHAEQHVRLLGVLGAQHEPRTRASSAGAGRRGPRRRRAARPGRRGRERRADQLDDLAVPRLPAAATIIRGVVYCPCQNACSVSRRIAADRLLRPDHRAAQRVRRRTGPRRTARRAGPRGRRRASRSLRARRCARSRRPTGAASRRVTTSASTSTASGRSVSSTCA